MTAAPTITPELRRRYEVLREFDAHAVLVDGGFSIFEITCMRHVARWRACDDERRERRQNDTSFEAHERARWTRANRKRRLRAKVAQMLDAGMAHTAIAEQCGTSTDEVMEIAEWLRERARRRAA